MPAITEFLDGNKAYGYLPVLAIAEPGKSFHYSGGGFLVLQHLVETLGHESAENLLRPFLDALGMQEVSFDPNAKVTLACGYQEDGREIPNGHKIFPAFAAGATGTARGVMKFLGRLHQSYQHPDQSTPLSHDTAMEMCFARDLGSLEFMGAKMGRGIFIAEAGSNKIVVHQGANDGFRSLFLHCYKGPRPRFWTCGVLQRRTQWRALYQRSRPTCVARTAD